MGRSKSIVEKYFIYCESSFNQRNGTVACDVLPPLCLHEEYPYQAKPETTAEHMGRAAFLAGCFMMYYPDVIAEEKRFDYLMQVLTHDTGEYKNGDVLDDGSVLSDTLARAAKDEEMEIMDEFYSDLPGKHGMRLVEITNDFESYRGEALFFKLIEKLDAVLFQIFLYTKGVSGDIRRKQPHPSKRDLRYAKIIDSTRAIDVWAFHLRLLARDFATEEYWKPVRKVLETAFCSVYGYLPSCMTVDVAGIPLDAPEDYAA
jgi:5'-deoxynucleotidase YfbR-like HD superfamily hydrolase